MSTSTQTSRDGRRETKRASFLVPCHDTGTVPIRPNTFDGKTDGLPKFATSFFENVHLTQ